MSSYYSLIVSEFRYYSSQHNEELETEMTKYSQYYQLDPSPPSYSAVLEEKKRQQEQERYYATNWDKKLDEIDRIMESMKQSMADAEHMIRYCCQRLEHKSQFLLLKFEKELHLVTAIIGPALFDKFDNQVDVNGSLNRMNKSLEKLISEAKSSLNTPSNTLYAEDLYLRRSHSCPRFSIEMINNDKRVERETISGMEQSRSLDVFELDEEKIERNRAIQKKRYFHSQWRLTVAMKQLINTVKEISIEKANNSNQLGGNQKRNTIHHVHIYNLQETHINLTNKGQEDQPPLKSTKLKEYNKFPLKSLFKNALYSVVESVTIPLISKQEPPQTRRKIIKCTTKSQVMFFSTILVLQKFNTKLIWMNRKNQIICRWNQKHLQQKFNLWMHHARLLLFIIQVVALSKRRKRRYFSHKN